MELEHLQRPILEVTRREFLTLPATSTVAAALTSIRQQAPRDAIIYFYVLDEQRRLAGVLPTRRLLTAPLEQHIAELMVPRVIAIPCTATVLDACELFLCHKFLAFPVVDEERRIVGIVDVGLLTEEVVDISEKERMDDLFQTLGFRVAAVQNASPTLAFRYRFPWLLATIASGTVCALLAGAYEATLARSLVIAFFLTLVLGLGESVSAQSMTLALQATHGGQLTLDWFRRALRRELATAFLLGSAASAVVALIVWVWRQSARDAAVIGGSILASMVTACAVGLAIPTLLRVLKLDPKIAAGPVTLAIADILTLLFFFNLAAFAL